MKQIRKISCLMLALIMVLSLSVTAFAANPDDRTTPADGSVTIVNAVPKEQYTLYKIFDLTYTGTDQEAPKPGEPHPDIPYTGAKVAYTITKTADNASFIEKLQAANSPFNCTSAGGDVFNIEVKSQTLAEITNFLKENVEYFEKIGETETISDPTDSTQATSEYTWEKLEYGYYYVASSVGASVSIDSTLKHVYVKDKNNLPTHTKKQSATENQPTYPTIYQDTETGIKVGDNIWYFVEIKIGDVMDKQVSITDTMSKGLTYKSDPGIGVGLKRGTDEVATIDSTNYTLVGPTKNDTTGETTFTLTFSKDYVETLKKDDLIWIRYGATVNDEAIASKQENSCTLNYSNQHVEKTTDATTYKFQLEKTDGANPLYGAVFELYDGDTVATGTKVWFKKAVKDENGIPVIYIVPAGTEGAFQDIRLTDSTVDTEHSNSLNNTKVIIKGLDSGKYILHETENPEGYKLATDTAITTDITLKASEPFPVVGRETDLRETQKGIVPVVNAYGQELPSTGGIGTTIFYVVGSILLVGAGVLLVTKKRMSAQ